MCAEPMIEDTVEAEMENADEPGEIVDDQDSRPSKIGASARYQRTWKSELSLSPSFLLLVALAISGQIIFSRGCTPTRRCFSVSRHCSVHTQTGAI